MPGLTMVLPDDVIEQIAQRAAEIVAGNEATEVDGWLTVAEAAEYLRCSTGRIYQLVSARRIPFHKDSARSTAARRVRSSPSARASSAVRSARYSAWRSLSMMRYPRGALPSSSSGAW